MRRPRVDGTEGLEVELARSSICRSLFTNAPARVTRVGRYVLRQRLGAGGMGIVFAAHDPSLDRDVAIKLLHPRNASPAADALLLEEARNTARLVHPALVTIFDVGLHEGRGFIAMELVAGRSMAQWLRARPPWRECVAVLARAARGIEAAHARGIIHRDFKPANVLLGRDGRVCVADFGLAREISAASPLRTGPSESPSGPVARALSRSGDIVGTPSYMAPEQYLGTAQDERTDQFAFCVTLYESLLRRRPFAGTTLEELRGAILTSHPSMEGAGDLPTELLDAVSRGLSKSRRARFPSMGELAAILETHSAGVDLPRGLHDTPQAHQGDGGSKFEAYLRQLPNGLDTSPGQTLPSRVYQATLAKRPLTRPPAALVPILQRLPGSSTIPAVHARAILNAIYDEHFDSLDQWRAFVAEMSQGAVKLLLTSFTIPSPASPYFVPGLVSTYNRHASGVRVEVLESGRSSATVCFHHPPLTNNDVSLVAWEELVRAAILSAGCRFVEVVNVERTDASFILRAHWR